MRAKVRAFTLNEIVIVMIISIIVISLAFTVLSLVQRHMRSIQENFNLNSTFNRLEQVLWIDTNNYNRINYNAAAQELKFKSATDSTLYQFKPDYILKDRDTFNVAIEEKIFFFNGIKTNNGKVDAFRLELPKKFKDQRIFIFKHNDAVQFVD